MEIKKKIKKTVLNILLVAMLLSLMSCDVGFLSGDGISPSEDSGFDLLIFNYSDQEYKKVTFYLGYNDANNKFVASDSLVFTNIIIYKKGDGPNYNEEKGYSTTYPFIQNSKGSNKYGVWEPNQVTKNAYFNNKEIKVKVSFQDSSLISRFSRSRLNGRITFRILENGEISW